MATHTGIPKARLAAELKKLRNDPPDGIRCWPRDGSPSDSDASFTFDQDGGFLLDVSMTGPAGTPYQDGNFQLACRLPPNYPVAPPHVKFITRVYHPNMDGDGRICIPVLKEGTESDRWNPVRCNIRSALAQIRQLLAEPNPHDPLDAEAARLMLHDVIQFQHKAREYTRRYATSNQVGVVAPAARTSGGLASSSSSAARQTGAAAPLSGPNSSTASVNAIQLNTASVSGSSGLLKGATLKTGLTAGGSVGTLLGGKRPFSASSANTGQTSALLGPKSTTPPSQTPSAIPSEAESSTVHAHVIAASSTTRPRSPSVPPLTSMESASTNPPSKRSRDPEHLRTSYDPPSSPVRSSPPSENLHPSKKARLSIDLPASPAVSIQASKKDYKLSKVSPSSSPPRPQQQVKTEQSADVVQVSTSSSSPMPQVPSNNLRSDAPAPDPEPATSTMPGLAGSASARPLGNLLLSGTATNASAGTTLGRNSPLGSVTATTGGLLCGQGGSSGTSGLFGTSKANSNGTGGGGLLGRASALGGLVGTGAGAQRTGLLGKGGLFGASKQSGTGGSIFGGKSGLFSKKPSG